MANHRAAISEAIQQRIVDHVKNDTTDLAPSDLHVPIIHFSDERHAAREREALRRQFLIAAHSSEVPEPDSFITREIMGTALLIVRNRDGQVAAFLNMCRHRGGQIEMAESGKRRFFVCSYHGWSYASDGALRGVPYESGYDLADRACRNLIAVRCEERHGLVWVNLSEGEGGVSDFLGETADAHMATFGVADMEVFRKEVIHADINWKIVLDGASDILHPQFLHANGVGKLLSTAISAWETMGRHGQSYSPRKRLVDSIRQNTPFDIDWRYFGANMYVWPNAMIIPTPDHIEFWRVWPSNAAVAKAKIEILFLVRSDHLDDRVASRINKSWELLNQAALDEDFPMEETIQRNAQSFPHGTFLYGRSEVSIQQLHREMEKELALIEG